MTVLHNGKYEALKACVHGVMLGTVGLCAAYNFAAWLVRRQRHLAINAAIYSLAVVWEFKHVQRHLSAESSECQVSTDEERVIETAA